VDRAGPEDLDAGLAGPEDLDAGLAGREVGLAGRNRVWNHLSKWWIKRWSLIVTGMASSTALSYWNWLARCIVLKATVGLVGLVGRVGRAVPGGALAAVDLLLAVSVADRGGLAVLVDRAVAQEVLNVVLADRISADRIRRVRKTTSLKDNESPWSWVTRSRRVTTVGH
jgi:hypothetical protein